MGPSPRSFVENFEPERGMALFAGFKHRFNDARDLCALLVAARTMINEADTIGEYFLGCHDSTAADVTGSLMEFSSAVRAMDYSSVFGGSAVPADSYFPFFFPSPASGSACKRLCMYLRWMVRREDGIDLGVWRGVSPPNSLFRSMPISDGLPAISASPGAAQPDWRMAREITASLRQFDPDDPVKYDFSLCHLGISEGCDGRDRLTCTACPIAEVCRCDP